MTVARGRLDIRGERGGVRFSVSTRGTCSGNIGLFFTIIEFGEFFEDTQRGASHG